MAPVRCSGRDPGVRAAVKYGLLRRFARIYRRRSERRIHPKQIVHPLLIRLGSSDISVFKQVFIEREYECLDDIGEVRLILDCGANVGYSSAFFLSRYPYPQVVAVEQRTDAIIIELHDDSVFRPATEISSPRLAGKVLTSPVAVS